MSATSEREVTPLCAKKIVVRINGNETDNVWVLVIINSAIVAGYVDTAATGIRFMQSMVIQKDMERLLFKK